jgi:hypothetical protein
LHLIWSKVLVTAWSIEYLFVQVANFLLLLPNEEKKKKKKKNRKVLEKGSKIFVNRMENNWQISQLGLGLIKPTGWFRRICYLFFIF